MLVSQNVVRVLVALLAVVVCLGFIFFFLGADAAGAAQLLVYAGGVTVLLLFGVMITPAQSQYPKAGRYSLLAGVALGAGLTAMLSRLALENKPQGQDAPIHLYYGGSLEGAGRILILQYGLPLEVSAVLLLVALVFASMATWHAYRT